MMATSDSFVSRTLYLGGASLEQITAGDILSCVRGGPVEALRFLPDRRCAFIDFVDEYGARRFYARLGKGRCLLVKDVEVRVRWAKSTRMKESLRLAVRKGATRNVFVGGLAERGRILTKDEVKTWEEQLRGTCIAFGAVAAVVVVGEKRCAFVQMSSINEAMRVINELSIRNVAPWKGLSLNYGRDPCDLSSRTLSEGKTTGDKEDGQINEKKEGSLPMRTIYFGGIPTNITAEEICNVVRGGALEKIRILSEKRSAFITFIEEEAAHTFFSFTERHPGIISLGGYSVKVAWSPPSALPLATLRALRLGATRVIYLANIELASLQIEDLRDTFSRYGQIERISITHKPRNAAFIGFWSVEEAARAMEGIRRDPLFCNCQIEYGRDRCADPLVEPRPLPDNGTVYPYPWYPTCNPGSYLYTNYTSEFASSGAVT